MNDYGITAADQDFFAGHLETFVPANVFDAHCHLYRHSDLAAPLPALVAAGPRIADWTSLVRHMDAIIPRRSYSGLAFPYPAVGADFQGANQFLAEEIARHGRLRGEMMIEPAMDPEFIRENVRRCRFSGLKCYHLFSRSKPTFESPIEDYLPEEQIRIAHEERLAITLHMVRARALADPVNHQYIARMARKYPGSRWILAHAARGFNPYHTVEGIEALEGIGNIWCDTSAVTEPGAFEAIVRTLGIDRLLYGSDFPVTHLRGRCVAIGDSFLWLSAENTNFAARHAPVKPVLVLLESLRALKQACWNLRLSDSHVEKIFHGNAAQLLAAQG